MLSFLRRLLGLTPTPNTSAGSVRAVRRHTDSGSQGRATTDRYFSTMNAIQKVARYALGAHFSRAAEAPDVRSRLNVTGVCSNEKKAVL